MGVELNGAICLDYHSHSDTRYQPLQYLGQQFASRIFIVYRLLVIWYIDLCPYIVALVIFSRESWNRAGGITMLCYAMKANIGPGKARSILTTLSYHSVMTE